jgi:hypothetical protein
MAKQSFETRIKNLFRTFAKANSNAHALIIESLVHYGQHNGDSSMVERFAVHAFANQQHFRYQAFKAWLEEFTPIRISEPGKEKEMLTCKTDKGAPRFTAGDLQKCKDTPFYQYMPADKPLAAPKIGESLEITMARGLLTGTISEEDVIAYAATLVAKVKAKQKDSKVIDWAVKYVEQNQAA